MADQGAATAHSIFRVLQILTLLPAWALLSAVLAWYNDADQETPAGIIVLFVGCLLGSIWAFAVLIVANRARNTALWMTFWDLVAMAVLIAGVAMTANIANVECGNGGQNQQVIYLTADGKRVTANEEINALNNGNDNDSGDAIWRSPDNCNLIKAAWGLAIANIIMFFITAILAGVIWKQNKEADQNTAIIVEEPMGQPTVVREKVYADEFNDYPRRPHRSKRGHRDHDRHHRDHERHSRRASRSSRSAHRSSRSVPADRDSYV